MPTDFYLQSYEDNNLRLVSANGLTEITIKCEKSELTTKEYFDSFIEDTEAVQIGDYFKIERGNGTATAVYCKYVERIWNGLLLKRTDTAKMLF